MNKPSSNKNNSEKEKASPLTKKKQQKYSKFNFFYVLLLMFLLVLVFFGQSFKPSEISWLEFEKNILVNNDVDYIVVVNREIAEIFIKKSSLDNSTYKSLQKNKFISQTGPHFLIRIGSVESFENKLEKAQINTPEIERVDIKYINRTNWATIVSWLLPLGLIFLFWILMLRGIGKKGMGGSSIFNFGKSTAKLLGKDTKSSITFNDVAGLKEAKLEIKEIVDFLKNPQDYTKLGAKLPKGVMLVGPPGTGKTLMAKAVAGEAQVPFLSLSGSEFVEMFVGVGASRVRDLFKQAKEKSPSIIFIDEIDAIGRSRGRANAFQTNDERENTLNQLLTELDGFGTNTGVIVLAATNRADILDKALLRPGRFDRHIYLELPNKQERKEIFKVHMRPLKMDESVDVDLLASLSPGFSGADIANICNEAALIAARKKKNIIEHNDFMQARDRVVGGLERKSKIISPKEKKIVAYHEAGHAVASWYLKNVDALVKVSIIPRGKSLGAAWYLPEEHQIITKAQFVDKIGASLGGRVAEDIVFNEASSGAIDDLEKVTKLAYNMVAFYGLDKAVGPISFYDSTGENERLLGKPYSEHMAKLIDVEVQKIINESYQLVKKLLLKHRNELENLAQLLLEKEVVYKKDLEELLGERSKQTLQ